MRNEAEINAKLKERFEVFLRQIEREQNGLISEVDSTRVELIDLIEKYADEKGNIDKKRLRKLLRELETMDGYISDTILDEIENTIEESTNRAKRDILISLGVLAVGVIGSKKILDGIKGGVMKDEAKDGLTLEERIRRFSGNLVDDIRKTIRDGIYKGHSTVQINRALKKTIKKQEWQLKRLVATVSPNAYRRTIAMMAQEGNYVKAVRIIDRRGRHKNHESHECYRLAEQDPYGWGKGVYRPEDSYIYEPHPNCTAYYELLLKDDIERGD